MPAVGHEKVTKRAYEQDNEKVLRAVRFAEATVHNGLGREGLAVLTDKQISKLKTQIERDFLVSLLDN